MLIHTWSRSLYVRPAKLLSCIRYLTVGSPSKHELSSCQDSGYYHKNKRLKSFRSLVVRPRAGRAHARGIRYDCKLVSRALTRGNNYSEPLSQGTKGQLNKPQLGQSRSTSTQTASENGARRAYSRLLMRRAAQSAVSLLRSSAFSGSVR
jgi:hypothetical protein